MNTDKKNILIVEANFYSEISDFLREGAENHLKNNQINYEIISVMGALEIPPVISFAKNSGKYDGYIALGCVIRGETTHYDYVCSESARGLMDLGINHNLAIANGILTVENKEQAYKRASINESDKGGFVAKACLELIEIKEKFNE